MNLTVDGNYIFIGNLRGMLKQWEIEKGCVVKDFGRVHKNNIIALGSSGDSRVLVSTDCGGDVMLWDIFEKKIENFINFGGMRITTAFLD